MRPQLLCKDNPVVEKLTYPLLVSPKLDGVRCTLQNRQALSRTLKPIPNLEVQETLSHRGLLHLDGELIVGAPNESNVLNRTLRFVRARDRVGEDWNFYVFDKMGLGELPFAKRYTAVVNAVQAEVWPRIKIVRHIYVHNVEGLIAYEEQQLQMGYEGIVIRHPKGIYKHNRTTMSENNAWKLKRFSDHEAIVIGMIPLMHNANEAKISETGLQVRSKAKAGLIPTDKMGALLVRDIETGVEFELGTGFTDKQRLLWFRFWKKYAKGKGIVTYKKLDYGELNKPRNGVYKSLRMNWDM
jgi:DNA ligase-1